MEPVEIIDADQAHSLVVGREDDQIVLSWRGDDGGAEIPLDVEEATRLRDALTDVISR